MSSASERNGEPSTNRANVISMDEVDPEEPDWLFQDRIPRGQLTSIAGDPGVGKSTLIAELVAHVTRGDNLPASDTPSRPEPVVLLCAEDDPRTTIRPRLEDAGAILSKVKVLTGVGDKELWRASSSEHLSILRDEVLEPTQPGLMVLDPLMSYMGDVNTHRDASVREVLGPLQRLAAEHDMAVVGVRHLRKGSASKTIYRSLGSIAFTASVRSELMVGKSPDEPEERVLLHTKSNLAERAPTLGFRIQEDGIHWTGLRAVSADEVLGSSGRDAPALEEAMLFLWDQLADKPLPATEVLDRADDQSISERTLRRAKKKLDVKALKSREEDGIWYWGLTEGCHERMADFDMDPSSDQHSVERTASTS